MSKIKYIDLFAGCGGLTEGFLTTNKYHDVASVEWLKPQVETLRHRLTEKWGYENSEDKVLHFDIQNEEELFTGWDNSQYGESAGLDSLVENAEGIDLVIGGPPCQAYSVAGRVRDKDGMKTDYRNYLFEHYLNIVDRYKPKMFVFENVPGMLSAKPGDIPVTELVKKGFDSIGYNIINNIKDNALINAADYGVPQNRKRVIIVGISTEIAKEEDIQKLLLQFYNELLPKYKSEKNISVYETLKDLEKFEPQISENRKTSAYLPIKGSGKSVSWHTPRFHSLRDKEIFSLLAEDIEKETNKFPDSKSLSKLYEDRVGSKSPIHRYHVLRKDKPSTTIIAHLYKDGNRFIHYDYKQQRTITPREAARLQSFADDFEFIGGQGAVYQMIGNAVPPKLGTAIGNAIHDLYKIIIN